MSAIKERPPRDRLRRQLTRGWQVVWVISLLLPVASFERSGYEDMRGWHVLLIGALGPMVKQFGWLANLSFMALNGSAFTFRTRPITDVPLALASLACAVDAFFWRAMYDDMGTTPLRSFAIGFYVWQIAIVGSAATTLWYWLGRPQERPPLP